MTRNVVVLGGGTGGTIAANRLRRVLGDDVVITVVDRDDDHVYQPGLLFLPFGTADAEDLVRPRARQLRAGVRFTGVAVDRVDVDANRVHLVGGGTLDYDVLVVATGARLMPEETEGLTGPGWGERVFTFYDLPGATALAGALRDFTGGRLVVNVVDLPIKCPVAPLEFCFLADWYFRERGIRDDVELTYVTPLDAAFTKPVAAATLSGLLGEKGIELVTEFNTGEVDGAAGRLVSYDEREVPFDLAVVVPVHGGASYVERSPGLGDALGFVPTNPRTLQSTVRPNIFALGDAAAVPTSKAGSVTHFEGEVLTRNVVRFLDGAKLDEGFDGHTNCFIESGFGKALLIDFNYDTEPLPGHFPGAVGLVQDELREPARRLHAAIPAVYEGFAQLHDAALAAGALDAKTKELIALAISISKGCDGCIAAHARGAALKGASPEEAAESIGVAILMNGGPGTVYGPRAYAAFQEFHDRHLNQPPAAQPAHTH